MDVRELTHIQVSQHFAVTVRPPALLMKVVKPPCRPWVTLMVCTPFTLNTAPLLPQIAGSRCCVNNDLTNKC
jgi:hypothetical protein